MQPRCPFDFPNTEFPVIEVLGGEGLSENWDRRMGLFLKSHKIQTEQKWVEKNNKLTGHFSITNLEWLLEGSEITLPLSKTDILHFLLSSRLCYFLFLL